MNDTNRDRNRLSRLRQEAERLVAKHPGRGRSEASIRLEGILQELDIYHAELEIQNEELERSRAALQEAYDRYEHLFRKAPVGYVVLDREGLIQSVNAEATAVLGVNAARLRGRPLSQFVAEDSLDTYITEIKKRLGSGGSAECELQMRRTDGGVMYVKASTFQDIRESGQENETLVALTDITELRSTQQELRRAHRELRKRHRQTTVDLDMATSQLDQEVEARRQAQKTLSEAEQKYEWMVENTNEGIAVIQDGRFKFVNRRLCEVTGQEEKALIGARLGPFIHESDRDWVVPRLQTDTDGSEEPKPFDFRVMSQKGNTLWANCNAVLVDWDGRRALLAFLSNVTARKQAEMDLAYERDILEQVLRNIPVLIAMYDSEGRVVLVNEELEQVIGWTHEDFAKAPPMELCYPDPAYRHEVWEFMTEGVEEWRNLRTTAKNGDVVDVAWTNVELSNGYKIGIGLDIRDRLQSERDLREAYEQLEMEQEAIVRKNVALEELIGEIKSKEERMKRTINGNFERSVVPMLERIKGKTEPSVHRALEILEDDLRSILSPFMARLSSEFQSLTPREQEVCRLIRGGLTSKEIAAMLNLSPGTVQKYRELIRKKLGLSGSKENLVGYLRTLGEE